MYICAHNITVISLFSQTFAFFSFFAGLIWSEVKELWDVGLHEYVNDMWNVIDFVTNSLYVATVALRIVSYYQVMILPLYLIEVTTVEN